MQEELLLILGEFAQSRAHGEQGLALYDTRQHRSHIFLFGNDSGVGNRGQAALVLWILGYPDQAVSEMNEALALAQEVAHPFDTTRSLFLAASLAHFRRETHLIRERAETVIALSAEHGFALFSGWGPVLYGWALAENGQAEEGIPQIHRGLDALRAIEVQVFGTYWLVLLAEAYGKAGQPAEGLKAVKEALKVVENTGERWWEAELYRLKGTLALQQAEARGWTLETSPSPRALSLKPQVSNRVEQEAEGHFLKALAIARRQQAKSLELRAATSLARLWQSQGKRDEARQMLAEIYGWFTQGFDTKDLQEAKALLTELAEGR
jgi:predicted ATPase